MKASKIIGICMAALEAQNSLKDSDESVENNGDVHDGSKVLTLAESLRRRRK
ncbi:MAG: hypothetical protein ACJ8LM_15655 [Candidatus Udaeobacter sp.]